MVFMRSRWLAISVGSVALAAPAALVACSSNPPRAATSASPAPAAPTAPPSVVAVPPPGATAEPAVAPEPQAAPDAGLVLPTGSSSVVAVSPDDPTGGHFTLDDATDGLTGSGDLLAVIATTKGTMSCRLFADKAPVAVANFVGMARGTRPWKDPATHEWITRPLYNGTIFHRVIKGYMIQGGDPLGTGKGEPGFAFQDEIWPGSTHDRAGQLCTANRGPGTNGAQFFITDGPARFLDGQYPIFGECKPLRVISAIASVPVTGPQHSMPVDKVTIKTITIKRGTY